MVDMNKLQRMCRRRFLEKLSLMGVSATTLNFITQESLAETTGDPEKEIPYVAYYHVTNDGSGEPQREPIYVTTVRGST